MVFWEPSLLMSIYNVRLTSVRVKYKACIPNDLRAGRRIGCIAGDRPALKVETGAIAIQRSKHVMAFIASYQPRLYKYFRPTLFLTTPPGARIVLVTRDRPQQILSPKADSV